MGLNPSCNLAEGIKGFHNLGDPPFCAASKNTALIELLEAGIPRGAAAFTTREVEVYKPDSEAAKLARCGISFPGACERSETMWIEVHSVTAEVYGWKFHRNWYYWVCTTDGEPLPLSVATKLHAEHGSQVRTDGSCTCPSPSRDVFAYHVDGPVGLAALVRVLKKNHEAREAAYLAEMDRKYGRP